MQKSDRRALLFIFIVVLTAWGAVLLDRLLLGEKGEVLSLDEVIEKTQEPSSTQLYYAVPENKGETFPFDPNTADSTALLRLGLSPWQVRSIYKYRAKGGRYHNPEDFKRSPGMTPEIWERLKPVIRIGEAFRFYHDTDSAVPRKTLAVADTTPPPHYQEKFREMVQLEVNSVDTATLKKIPGIASVRARRIVAYRERLGGFVSLDQLSEIEDLPTDIEVWFSIGEEAPRKIPVNRASVGEMARHPYMGYARARAIADYRRNYGNIHSLSELSLLPQFTEKDIQRLEPYVSYE